MVSHKVLVAQEKRALRGLTVSPRAPDLLISREPEAIGVSPLSKAVKDEGKSGCNAVDEHLIFLTRLPSTFTAVDSCLIDGIKQTHDSKNMYVKVERNPTASTIEMNIPIRYRERTIVVSRVKVENWADSWTRLGAENIIF